MAAPSYTPIPLPPDKQPAHIRDAVVNRRFVKATGTTSALVDRYKAMLATARKGDVKSYKLKGYSVWLSDNPKVRGVFYHYDKPVLKLADPLGWGRAADGLRFPRGVVTVPAAPSSSLPSKSTRDYVNGLCSLLGLDFFCWQHDNALWALWSLDNSGTYAHAIDPTDLTFVSARNF